MSPEAAFVFIVLGVAGVLFASGKVRLDVTALLVVLALMLSGVLSVAESVAGFGDPLVLIIVALFIVGEALVQTGIAYRIGDWLLVLGGGSEVRRLVLLMVATMVLSGIMSSTAVVAIFIPIVMRMATKTGTSASRMLMPLSYAALFGGMVTLIATTPNLVVNAALEEAGAETFGLLSFTPVGLAVFAAGVLYMLLIGRRFLPARESGQPGRRDQESLRDIAMRYGLVDRVQRLRVRRGSPLVRQSVRDAGVRSTWSVEVLAVERATRRSKSVVPASVSGRCLEGDVLVVEGPAEALDDFAISNDLESLPVRGPDLRRLGEVFGLAEVLVTPESKHIGKTIREAAFRTRSDLTVLGIKRSGEVIVNDFAGEDLAAGDILLVGGQWKHIRLLEPDPLELLVLTLPGEIEVVAPARERAPVAAVVLVLMVVMLMIDVIPMLATVLIAALAMVAGGCLTMNRAYRSIDWQSIVLVAGLLPIAEALRRTGGIELVAAGIGNVFYDPGPRVAMTIVFFLTAVLGLVLSNTASALLVVPIAIKLAEDIGVAPQPLALMVIIAASAAFSTPVSTPVVTLVVAPGNYRFMDFVKIGVPLLFITWLVSLLVIPLLFPY